MKQPFFLSASLLLFTAGALYAPAARAQNPKSDTSGTNSFSEIIIRQKGNTPNNMDIRIQGHQVWVNGKKLDQGSNSSIMVLRRNVPLLNGNRFAFNGRPRLNGGIYRMNPGSRMQMPDMNPPNQALLGVFTRNDSLSGARITHVDSGTAAQKAGLQDGDIITAVNQTRIGNSEDLVKAIGQFNPGEEVEIHFTRNGTQQSTQAKLGKRPWMDMQYFGMNPGNPGNPALPDFPGMPGFRGGPGGPSGHTFHFRFAPPQPKPSLGLKIQDSEQGDGVKVLEVLPGSPADKAGVKKNDLIRQWSGKEIHHLSDLQDILQQNGNNYGDLKLGILRDGMSRTIRIHIQKPLSTMNL